MLGFVGADVEEVHAARLASRDARYCVVEERRALALALETVFTELAAHRLWLDVSVDNEQGGRFRSLVLMAMLEGEFRGK